MNKEEFIIRKLISVVSNQQRILTKLAQAMEDPNSQYLKGAAQQAAANTGFTATDVQVLKNSGVSGTVPGSSNLINTEDNYLVHFKGAPKDNKMRQKFVNVFKTQIRTQKPELEAKVSITFDD